MPFRKFLKERISKLSIPETDKQYHIETVNTCSESDLSLLLYELGMNQIYKEYPVDIKTFIHDPYYLGSIYSDIIYPIWEDLLIEVYPAPLITKYNEVILSCATRSGKSTAAAISILYEIYRLMCMVDPAKFLVGKSTARLTFALMSKDEANAESVLGLDIQKGLLNAPYFIDNINKKLTFSSLTKDGVEITDNILLIAGSRKGTVIGRDLYACAYDEINMPSPNIAEGRLTEVRMDIYSHILDRKEATLSKAPPMSGIVWMMSSPTEEDDVINDRIESVKKIAERVTEVERGYIAYSPSVRILDNVARWDARNEQLSHTFDFYLGSDTKDPEILTKESDYARYEPDKIIKVPYKQEYYSIFKERPIFAIRDIAGRRTTSDAALFNSVAVFQTVFSKKNDIFTKDILTINFGGNAKELEIKDYLYDKDYFKHPRNKGCFRYIHLDIASSVDKFGLASVYSDMVKFRSSDGLETRKRMYFVDFALGIGAASGCIIDMLKVLEWVYNLKKKEGYPIKLLTTDSHQGTLARQIIQKNGVNTEYLSVEKTKEPFYNMKNIVITESLVGFENSYLIKELGGLRDFKNKIDKSKGNTDDVAGALAGALYSCMRDDNFKNNNEAFDELIDIQNENKMENITNQNLIQVYSTQDYNNMQAFGGLYDADQWYPSVTFDNGNNGKLGRGL